MMSAAVAGTTFRPTASYTTLRDVTHVGEPDGLNDDNGVTCPQLPCPCGATPLPPAAPLPVRAPSTAPLAPLPTTARVSRVVDGDTLKVRLPAGQIANVGLIGVDSPEPGKLASRGECGALEASAQMKRLVLRNRSAPSVTLQTDPTQARVDQSGRMSVYVSARGVDLGLTMIASALRKSTASIRTSRAWPPTATLRRQPKQPNAACGAVAAASSSSAVAEIPRTGPSAGRGLSRPVEMWAGLAGRKVGHLFLI